MNTFLTGDLVLTALSKEEIKAGSFKNVPVYQTKSEVLFDSTTAKGVVAVAAGFKTDLATIPKLVQGLFLLHDDPVILKPSVLHDYLYSLKGRIVVKANYRLMAILLTRQQCDYILCYEAMPASGATKIQCDLVYTALRLLGDSWGEGYSFSERFKL